MPVEKRSGRSTCGPGPEDRIRAVQRNNIPADSPMQPLCVCNLWYTLTTNFTVQWPCSGSGRPRGVMGDIMDCGRAARGTSRILSGIPGLFSPCPGIHPCGEPRDFSACFTFAPENPVTGIVTTGDDRPRVQKIPCVKFLNPPFFPTLSPCTEIPFYSQFRIRIPRHIWTRPHYPTH